MPTLSATQPVTTVLTDLLLNKSKSKHVIWTGNQKKCTPAAKRRLVKKKHVKLVVPRCTPPDQLLIIVTIVDELGSSAETCKFREG